MLISKALDAKSCFESGFGERREVHMSGNVLFARFFEGSSVSAMRPVTAISAVRAMGGKKVVACKSVVDDQDEAVIHSPYESVNPVAGGWAEFGNGACNALRESLEQMGQRPSRFTNREDEPLFLCRHTKLLPAVAVGSHQVKWESIQEFVGKMDSLEDRHGVEVVDPANLALQRFQYLLLTPSQGGKWFDDPVVNGLQHLFLHGGEDIQSQLSVVRPLFDQSEPFGRAEPGPHFPKLARENSSEDRTHADIREKVPVPANLCPAGRIVPGIRIVESELHKAGEGQWSLRCDLGKNLTVRE